LKPLSFQGGKGYPLLGAVVHQEGSPHCCTHTGYRRQANTLGSITYWTTNWSKGPEGSPKMDVQNALRDGVAALAQAVERGTAAREYGGLMVGAWRTRLVPGLLVMEVRFQFMRTRRTPRSSAAASRRAAASGSFTCR